MDITKVGRLNKKDRIKANIIVSVFTFLGLIGFVLLLVSAINRSLDSYTYREDACTTWIEQNQSKMKANLPDEVTQLNQMQKDDIRDCWNSYENYPNPLAISHSEEYDKTKDLSKSCPQVTFKDGSGFPNFSPKFEFGDGYSKYYVRRNILVYSSIITGMFLLSVPSLFYIIVNTKDYTKAV